MSDAKLLTCFPGTLYAGETVRLAGRGPDLFNIELDAAFSFKCLIAKCENVPEVSPFKLVDRLWVLPQQFTDFDGSLMPLLFHFAGLVRAGGKVRLASADKMICEQVRDMLLFILATPEGEI